MDIKLCFRGTLDWTNAVALVREKYKENFKADITPDPDYFVVVSEQAPGGAARRIMACAGLSFGLSKPFFSERYIDEPVEQLLSRLEKTAVARESIVEVGSITSMDRTASIRMMKLLPMIAMRLGKQYGFFTLTKQMRQIFQFLGVPSQAICAAEGTRLSPEALAKWGTYYQSEPVTGFLRVADQAGLIAEALERYQFSFRQDEEETPLMMVAGV
jgi:hypothetical protein